MCTYLSMLVDPYALADEDLGPQESLSRHLPSRALGTHHGTVRRRPSGKRRGSVALEDMETEEEENLEPVESFKAIAAPMHQKREMW